MVRVLREERICGLCGSDIHTTEYLSGINANEFTIYLIEKRCRGAGLTRCRGAHQEDDTGRCRSPADINDHA